MSLFETASDLREALARFDQRKTASKRAQTLGDQRNELLRCTEAMREARAKHARLLRRAPSEMPLNEFQGGPRARKKAGALREHFVANKTEIYSRKAFAAARSEAQRVSRWFDDEAARIWKTVTREVAQDRVTGLRKILGQSRRFADQLEELSRLQEALQGIAREIPDSDQIVEQFFELAALFENRRGELPLPTSDNQEVTAFLRAAASTGAPISSLTNDVREWLAAHELEHDFIIRMK